MKSKDNGGFWSTLLGVTVKASRTFEALDEDKNAVKKSLLVLLLFFGLLGIFFVIFLDKGYPGTTLFTLPINIEKIYSTPIWFPAAWGEHWMSFLTDKQFRGIQSTVHERPSGWPMQLPTYGF